MPADRYLRTDIREESATVAHVVADALRPRARTLTLAELEAGDGTPEEAVRSTATTGLARSGLVVAAMAAGTGYPALDPRERGGRIVAKGGDDAEGRGGRSRPGSCA